MNWIIGKNVPPKYFLILGLAAAGTTLFWGWKKKKWFTKKKVYSQVGEVAYMFLYPIKSCRGIKFTAARCTTLGLQVGPLRDRVFLLVNEEGVFVTARQEHKMLLIIPSLKIENAEQNILAIDAPGMATLSIDLDKFKDPKQMTKESIRHCKVWGQPVDGWDCGQEVNEWFRKFLGKDNYSLVHHNERIRPKYAKEREKYKDLFIPKDAAAFADLTPYLLMTEASVQDVNSRIDKVVRMRNFRPNIVLRASEPYAEDKWLNVNIGENATFRHTKPCQRYRKTQDPFFKQYVGESALLGIGLCVDTEGDIKTGDPVFASTR